MEKKKNWFAFIVIMIYSKTLSFWEWFCLSVCWFCKLVVQGTSFWQTCLESVYTEGLIWMKVKACSVNLLSWSSALTMLSCSAGQEKQQGSDAPDWTPGSAPRSSETMGQLLNVSEFQFCNLSNSINKSLARKNKKHLTVGLYSVQFRSVTQPCPTLCDPMNCSMPGLPVHHQLREFTQTHVHWVADAI